MNKKPSEMVSPWTGLPMQSTDAGLPQLMSKNLSVEDLMSMMPKSSPPLSPMPPQNIPQSPESVQPETVTPPGQIPTNTGVKVSMSHPVAVPYHGNTKPLMDQAMMAGQQSSDARDEELDRLTDMRRNYEGVNANKSAFDRMDLSALNGFVDSMFGSKLSQSYKAPSSGEQDLSTMNTLNDRVSNHLKNKTAERQAMYKMLLDSQNKSDVNDLKSQLGMAKLEAMLNKSQTDGGSKLDMSAQKLSGIVNDASTRKERGRYQAVIDSTDKLTTMLNEIYPPKPGETEEERIQRFNLIPDKTANELVTAFDSQIKGGGQSTAESYKHVAMPAFY